MKTNMCTGTMDVRRKRSASWAGAVAILLGLMICLGWAATQAAAQTTGEGAIVGTVKDATGALIANAKITATNNATGIATVRTSSSSGFFTEAPLPPGLYTVQVEASGFKTLVQENLVLDALQTLGFNPVLTVGTAKETVTVTAAPPVLHTEDATLGLTMENETYTNLPLQMTGGGMRDPTAFGVLTPGAQAANNGGRLPVVGGTGSYLGQLYLDGMPAETVTQQGDNRLVSLTMPVEAVDQFQLMTSSPPAQYMGAGAENFTMKSGGNKFHGQASDFVRNTAFDTWSFTAKAATVKDALGNTLQAPKPIEHQNEMSFSGGGFVPHTGHKVFFFAAYDKYHYRKGASYSLTTVPTAAMVQGDFTELVATSATSPINPVAGQSGTGASNPAFLFNPLSNSCVGSVCTRTALHGPKPGSGVDSNNVIPANLISPIAQAMQKGLPAPSNPSVLTNNYLQGQPGGYDNHAVDWRVDYDLSAKQRISSVGAMGAMNYLNNWAAPLFPLPWTGGDMANIYPKDYVIGDTYTVSPNLVNQLKMSFTRFFQNIHNNTQGMTAFQPSAYGISNVPLGQAGQEFPSTQFATTSGFGTVQSAWTGIGTNQTNDANSTQLTTPNNYAITDNIQWLRGKHSLTFGLTYQFQDDNNANPATYTGTLALAFNAYSTAQFSGTSLSTGGSGFMGSGTTPYGYSYASYLLGAVGNSPASGSPAPSLGLHPVSELAGRFKPYAPYAEDIIKLTPKLTLDLGLRWDYMPPFHEAQNRWTYMNPGLTNPLTNSPGMLQFAGNWGGTGVSCGCKTPVKTYWLHFGPRASVAYAVNPKTVLRAGFAQVYSEAGGVGGRGGAAGGTGQLGFNTSAGSPSEVTNASAASGPSYYLNNSAGFTSASMANTSLFGAGYAYPAAPTPGLAAQESATGFYASGTTFKSAVGAPSGYADPYLSGRAPEFVMWNAGFERSITPDMTLSINYVGNESHFIINSGTNGSNARGYWVNQLDPKYLAGLGPVKSTTNSPILTAPATTANIAIAQAAMPGLPAPAFIQTAANLGSAGATATIQQMLLAFPQYSSLADTWGNVGNFSYESVQVSLNQRMSHGLSFNFNYTFSKNIGDDGSFRSGFAIPAAAISHGSQNWAQDRMDRSYTVISAPNKINAFGVYKLPFGKGHIGSNNRLVRWAAGGWQLSGIYTFTQGAPIGVTWSGCTATTYPGQGQCMPDINPSYPNKSAHISGKWGSGPNGFNTCNLGINALGQSGCKAIQYLDLAAFQTPLSNSTASTNQYLLGNAPRNHAFQLRAPYIWNIDSGLRRTIPIHESINLVIEADCLNTLNHPIMGGPGGSWASGSATFGTITGVQANPGPRDFQFAGHFNF